MHTPLPSIIALARFSFAESELTLVRLQLDGVSDWQEWLDQVELHGLSGFVNKALSEFDLPIPKVIQLSLRALKVRHQAAANARYEVLCQIHAEFAKCGIPYLALKGAALMPHLYKAGFLRPMRDMDLLIPQPQEQDAAQALRRLGFDVPDKQPSRFMRNMHELPNATKQVNGFNCSVELHRDALSREISGHLVFPTFSEPSDTPDVQEQAQRIQAIPWQALVLPAFDNVTMLHQVCRHLEGLHSGGVLKLINVMDVIGLAALVLEQGDWQHIEKRYPHVINSLYCLHLLTPLTPELQHQLKPVELDSKVSGVGQIMVSLSSALTVKRPLSERVQLLFMPSDWWLHLHYNVHPRRSLFWIKCVKHPMKVGGWLFRRLYSGLLGG